MNKRLSVFMNIMLSECCSNFARLFLRVFIGVLMLSHGIAKIENFDLMVDTFPDPLGMGRAIFNTNIVGRGWLFDFACCGVDDTIGSFTFNFRDGNSYIFYLSGYYIIQY